MEISGLPLHPLVVHAVVVLVPLSAVGGLVIAFSRWARKRYGSLLVLCSLVAAVSTFVAQQAGEAFYATFPQTTPAMDYHRSIGDGLLIWTILLFVGTLVLVIAQRLIDADHAHGRIAWIGGLVITVVAAVVAVVQTIRIGDAGATAVWG